MVQVQELSHALELAQAGEVVVGLRIAWERIARGQIFVGGGEVNGVREEDLVVDVDMLLHGLVRVQRRQLSFDDGLCTSGGRLQEVGVDLVDCSLLLDPLVDVFSWELVHDLELFVPVTHRFGIVAKQRRNRLAQVVCTRYFDGLLWLPDPWRRRHRDLCEEVWLGL